MSRPTVAVVTGANRGIGEAIVQTLASSAQGPLLLYAASRKGLDMGLRTTSNTEVKYPKLDIADSTSIESLARTIKQEHANVDVLINNAGVNLDDEYSPENVQITLDTNARGTLKMCQAFIPLLSKTGRIVNVSSTGSSLNQYSKEIQQRFRSPRMTLGDLEQMMQEYEQCARNGTERQHGWPQQSYSVSKACINALTAVLAREHPGLVINACCPGWVSTDMGKMVGSQPPKSPGQSVSLRIIAAADHSLSNPGVLADLFGIVDGARIPIRLGFGDIGGVTGRYWGNPSIADRGDGQVMDW